MTWLFISVVLIPSFLWTTKRGPFSGGFCALGAQSLRGDSGGDGQLRWDPVCQVQVQPSPPGCSPAPSLARNAVLPATAIVQARCSWCRWKRARVSGGDVPSSQRSSAQTRGHRGGAGPRAAGQQPWLRPPLVSTTVESSWVTGWHSIY